MFEKNVSFSVNSAVFCQLMCQSMSTYLAIGSAKALISREVECQLLWHVTTSSQNPQALNRNCAYHSV